MTKTFSTISISAFPAFIMRSARTKAKEQLDSKGERARPLEIESHTFCTRDVRCAQPNNYLSLRLKTDGGASAACTYIHTGSELNCRESARFGFYSDSIFLSFLECKTKSCTRMHKAMGKISHVISFLAFLVLVVVDNWHCVFFSAFESWGTTMMLIASANARREAIAQFALGSTTRRLIWVARRVG